MTRRVDIVGLDSSILMHPHVWDASGHTEGFTDPLRDCKECQFRFRPSEEKDLKGQEGGKKKGDKAKVLEEKNICPRCGSKNLTHSRPFNLMFKTSMGPLESKASAIYLRPETAQGIFTNFENIKTSMRKKIPFGVAQIGKAFRNEITPGHFIFRMREFEQMEMQYFVSPEGADSAFEKWREIRWNFYKDFKFNAKNLRWHKHGASELAHYAKAAFDIYYRFPFGWQELEGLHNRGDFDLSRHQEKSGKKLEFSFENTKFIPHVIEASSGCDRLCLALLCDSYVEEELFNRKKESDKEKEKRVILKLPLSIAPYTVAFLPLSKKSDLKEKTLTLREEGAFQWDVDYDETGSIGKRYRRQDEIGTPFCVTVDFDSLTDQKITVRHRDAMNQERIPMEKLKAYIQDNF